MCNSLKADEYVPAIHSVVYISMSYNYHLINAIDASPKGT